MIEFYPIFYRTVIKPLNQTTERELDELTRQFNSSNLNIAMEL
jgi:hypothetical protein